MNSSNAPSLPHKRRRPALSCEQCRRRKVQCDRKMPCGPCKKTRPSLACSYVHEGKAALHAGLDMSVIDGDEPELMIPCSPRALLNTRGGYVERTRLAQLEHSV
ncbi:hypothetical protein BGW36DRAFT_371072 [Talaromyces proteolyticus]|uniref:Zn(2)-C6 fungal-type domain-containing protein n=1 Tax=Talaromyces proteolyticus TaxID=1131652 RepID=A0AAD4KUN0_9EURO|nr:uncharacterized protein BGW36DRAFT_371072 [Talaromyces proteolyticus]KAH8701532.1 hypothetical protein BGW36DRAFT_371072 [Talaromyces proteolyticus]